MGCGNNITSKQYNETIKIINKCILENLINIKIYNNLYTLCTKTSIKEFIHSILTYKKYQLDILEEIYTLSTGDSPTTMNIKYTEKDNTKALMHLSIEREFSLINSLKSLRNSLPTPSLKNAISSLLIDENTIINKLIYSKSIMN